jgi:hypothetical protein
MNEQNILYFSLNRSILQYFDANILQQKEEIPLLAIEKTNRLEIIFLSI